MRSARGTRLQPLPKSIVYWAPTDHLYIGACGSLLPFSPTGTPSVTVTGVCVAAACACSTEQMPKAPVVPVPEIAVGPCKPTARFTAVTKPFATAAPPALGMTTQLDALVISLMMTVSVRPPEGRRGLISALLPVISVCR